MKATDIKDWKLLSEEWPTEKQTAILLMDIEDNTFEIGYLKDYYGGRTIIEATCDYNSDDQFEDYYLKWTYIK